MANAVVEALEKAAERIGKTLSKDAGKTVEDMGGHDRPFFDQELGHAELKAIGGV